MFLTLDHCFDVVFHRGLILGDNRVYHAKENYSLLRESKQKRKTSNCQKHSLEAQTTNLSGN